MKSENTEIFPVLRLRSRIDSKKFKLLFPVRFNENLQQELWYTTAQPEKLREEWENAPWEIDYLTEVELKLLNLVLIPTNQNPLLYEPRKT